MEFFRVFLQAPVYENLLLFALDHREALKIDPEPVSYFSSGPEKVSLLPGGIYFFTQARKKITAGDELLPLAIELQKEGLWNRYKLENKIYVRFLFEHDPPATQLWRPIIPLRQVQ